MEHTSFASPLDSILFHDSTHSFHFAQPLGRNGTSIPPFASHRSDTDVPTSAVLASLFPTTLFYHFACIPFSLPNILLQQPPVPFQVVAVAFPLSSTLELRSFVVFNPSPRQLLPRSLVRTSNIADMFQPRLENREYARATRRFAQVCNDNQVKAANSLREFQNFSRKTKERLVVDKNRFDGGTNLFANVKWCITDFSGMTL